MLTLPMKLKLGILGRLGSKTVEQITPDDIVSVGSMFQQVLSTDEATGILSLIQDESNLGEVAVKWLSNAADSGKLDFLKPGRSAMPELDLGEHDHFARCPECHNPQLLDLKELPPNHSTICPFCDHSYIVEAD